LTAQPRSTARLKNESKKQLSEALAACQDKKAEDISLLEMDPASGAFTDYFLICSGTNPRQIQAISDEARRSLSQQY
jgi:ribosome-associated protein